MAKALPPRSVWQRGILVTAGLVLCAAVLVQSGNLWSSEMPAFESQLPASLLQLRSGEASIRWKIRISPEFLCPEFTLKGRFHCQDAQTTASFASRNWVRDPKWLRSSQIL